MQPKFNNVFTQKMTCIKTTHTSVAAKKMTDSGSGSGFSQGFDSDTGFESKTQNHAGSTRSGVDSFMATSVMIMTVWSGDNSFLQSALVF